MRDLFYEGNSPTKLVNQNGQKGAGLTIVRHIYWIPKPMAMLSEMFFTFAKKKYNR